MKRPTCNLVLALCLLPLALHAQPKAAPTTELVARFNDGSTVRRLTLTEAVEIQTRFGKLSVPVRDIRRVEFATRISDEMAQQIDKAIEQLGSRNFQQREAAMKELHDLGHRAYHPLKKVKNISDKEVARRVEELLAEIETTLTPEQRLVRGQDIIHAGDSVLAGQITVAVLKGKTATFGEMKLSLAELRGLHSETQKADVTLDGVAFGVKEHHWADTGILVDNGSELRVTAGGQMDLYAKDQPGQQISGPDGNVNSARGPDGMLSGMLIGRIGENGQPFPLGSNYHNKAFGVGKLYVSIVPGGVGQTRGNYHVKVTSGEGPLPAAPALVSPGPTAPTTNLPAVAPGVLNAPQPPPIVAR